MTLRLGATRSSFSIYAALLLLAACSRTAIVSPPVVIAPKSVPDANFELTTMDVVETPEEDTVAFIKVYVDGELAGQTQAGPRSSERKWQGVLKPGNRLVRFEQWGVGINGEPALLGEAFQPRERFVRIEEGLRTRVALKFHDKGRKNAFQISRGPMP